MGLLSVLLQWHVADPVDARERARNDVVYSYQGNRNPFIDHPQWVSAIFLASTGPTLVAVAGRARRPGRPAARRVAAQLPRRARAR